MLPAGIFIINYFLPTNMNAAHIHLLVNHSPILGSLFGAVLLLIAVLRRNEVLIGTGLITLIVTVALAIPTQLSGDGAKKVVEDRPGVSKALIEKHLEAVDVAFWAIEVTEALELVSLLLRRPAQGMLFTRLTLAGALLSFGLLARVGSLSG